MKEVYGDHAPTSDEVKQCHYQFTFCVDDGIIHKVEFHRITIRQPEYEAKLCVSFLDKNVYDHLRMLKSLSRWIPRLLTSSQNKERVDQYW